VNTCRPKRWYCWNKHQAPPISEIFWL